MEKKAEVYVNDFLAGYLSLADGEYIFTYEDHYYNDRTQPAISLTLPKNQKSYCSKTLFAFFYGLLSEGDLKNIQCRRLGLDEKDYFSRLFKTARNTIGAVQIREVE